MTNNDGTRASETHTWTVATRDMGNTVPREADEFNAKIVTFPAYFDASGTRTRTDSPTAADCEAGGTGEQNQWSFTNVTLLANEHNTLAGFEFSSAALPVPANDAENTLVRVCVQATETSKEGTDKDGPWRLGGAVTITKNPAP